MSGWDLWTAVDFAEENDVPFWDDLISQDASPDDYEAWIEKMERERYG